MAVSERWQLGDVIIWFGTGVEQDAKTDSDVFLTFYAADGRPLRWLKAYERGDFGGFEEGEVNCGFVGNLHKSNWLKDVLDNATRIGIRIESDVAQDSIWFVEYVSLDFRVGPTRDVSTVRTWAVNDWLKPGEPERLVDADTTARAGTDMFEDVGFEKELEIETGLPEKPVPDTSG